MRYVFVLNLIFLGFFISLSACLSHNETDCFQPGVACQTAPSLVSIAISPTTPAVSLGLTQQLVASGTFSDGTTQNLSSSVNWSVLNVTGAAAVNSAGLVTTASGVQGTVTIRASSGSVVSSVTLTVVAPVLVSIAVTPTNPTAVVGLSQQFKATGTYSDNSTQNITSSVTWNRTNQSGSATISSSGLADTSSGSAGNVAVTASGSGVFSPAVTMAVANNYAISTGVGKFWPNIALGEAATTSQLNAPGGVALDSAGNLYVADTLNNVIRRVDHTTGFVTNAAGTGNAGYSGDGALATSSTLKGPLGVAVDASGNIFIADTGNNVIRRVDHSTQFISTFAGSGSSSYNADNIAATSAGMTPAGVAVDSVGNVYVADSGNFRIREIDAISGNIITVAGNGAYGFSGDGASATAAKLAVPQGVFVDGSGNIFIADTGNERIREVSAVDGFINTIGGTGTIGAGGNGGAATSAQFAQPMGVTVDGSGNVYVADEFNNRIQYIDGISHNVSQVAGTGLRAYGGDGGNANIASINYPVGVVVDGSGKVYIADNGNNVVREFVVAGTISTVAGKTPFGFGGDGALGTKAELYAPLAVTRDAVGNLYLADTNNNRIRKYDVSTGNISTIAGTGAVGYSGDGGLATAAKISSPYDLVRDPQGNIFFADTFNNVIRRIDSATGNITTVAGTGAIGSSGDGGPATAALIYFPRGIALDNAGNLYIADSDNNKIRKVDFATQHISTIAGTGPNSFSGDGGLATAATLNNPTRLAFDPAGNLYILDVNNVRVRKIDFSTGNISTVAGHGFVGFLGDGGLATAAAFYNPSAIAIDSSSNLFISDATNNRIRAVNAATGIVSTIAGNGNQSYSGDAGTPTSAGLYNPVGLVVDSAGNIFVADSSNNVIRKLTP